MAGAFFRFVIIYLCIGAVLHLGGVQTTESGIDPISNFISYDPLNSPSPSEGLNSSFKTSVNSAQTDMKVATGVFGFIDTLFSVVKFVIYMMTGMVFSPILLFSSYKLPFMFTYIFGTMALFGLIMGIIVLIRSGLSP